MRPVATATGTEALQISVSEGTVWAGIWAGLREGAHSASTETNVSRRGSSIQACLGGGGVIRLGRECGCCTGSHRWSYAYAEGQGEGNGSCQFLCSQRGLSVDTAPLRHAPRWAGNLPTVCPTLSSDHCFHTMFMGCLTCLLSKSNAMQCPLGSNLAKHADL